MFWPEAKESTSCGQVRIRSLELEQEGCAHENAICSLDECRIGEVPDVDVLKTAPVAERNKYCQSLVHQKDIS